MTGQTGPNEAERSRAREVVLRAGCRDLLGREPGAQACSQLLSYLGLLERWSATYNLTAVRDPLEMVTRHLLDSLAVLPWAGAGRLLDAGTGAGLPGVPLAIMEPDLDVTLLDSTGKKVRFLRQVQRVLALENIHPVQSRVESYRPVLPFDTIISRAFASLEEFIHRTRHALAPGGRWLAMKGRLPREELADLPPGIRVDRLVELEVAGLQEQRHLVIMSLSP